MANKPPSAPSRARINNKGESEEFATKSTGTVKVSAVIDDPNNGQQVRLVVRYSANKTFSTFSSKIGSYGRQTRRTTVTLTGLAQDTLYYGRLYTQDSGGKFSTKYNSISFWTNRGPTADIVEPADNVQFLNTNPVFFDWKFVDLDDKDTQKEWAIRWRRGPTPSTAAGAWTEVSQTGDATKYTAAGGTFKANQFYEWQIRLKDNHNHWGYWSIEPHSFYVFGTSTAPTPLGPIRNVAVDPANPTTFTWKFNDPDPGDSQTKADLRWRPVGTEDKDWNLIVGTTLTPGTAAQWILPANTFQVKVPYEWQVRTYDTTGGGGPSDWSASGTFTTIVTPGSAVTGDLIPDTTEIQGSLGQGTHRVFIYDRGGTRLRGELSPLAHVVWHRKRDDISNALITTNGLGHDGGVFLGDLRSWMHEVVIFRDGVRVWEGPITRITYSSTEVEIEAKDVMTYVYRRIMRQGYNDSYHVVQGVQQGLSTVTRRASLITQNALAPDDPNVLPYLTVISYADDAQQSRVVPDYSKTAWEEIDDLAATAGLDYTVVGRRIMYWDTHRSIGRLPEMRDEDFSDPPVVTEYGMNLSNTFGVTNGSGIFGEATPEGEEKRFEFYGIVELLASAYGESDGGDATTLTPGAQEALIATFEAQAKRNINHRWPTPLVVRVPDNTQVLPSCDVGINQLIPGVWIPLRAMGTPRVVAQWQKLDELTVEEQEGNEQVRVVMSPAPNGGQDPDADQAQQETN